MRVYYNEFDPKAAAWLRQLIINGDIADGVVDERSITDICANDLRGFTQHHFFAGIGTWSYALRNAGWSDDRPVCTASLPCQPFSAAGNQKGKADERHLLPHFLNLVRECRFNTIFGEQVPGAIKHGWLDDLYDEMEREKYAVGATVLTAAGAGKAHIRQRIYWVADSMRVRSQGQGEMGQPLHTEASKDREVDRVINASDIGGRLGNTEHDGHVAREKSGSDGEAILSGEKGKDSSSEFEGASASRVIPGETIEWLYCRDNKYRPIRKGIKPLVRTVKPSSKSLANGIARGVVYSSDSIITPNDTAEARAQRLKGYGNGIVAEVATEFITAFMEVKV